MLSELFVQPNDFADDIFVLHGGVEAFARVALLFQRLFIFVHAVSEDEVGACTRRILVFSRSFHSQRYVFVLKKLQKVIDSQKFNSRKCFAIGWDKKFKVKNFKKENSIIRA